MKEAKRDKPTRLGAKVRGLRRREGMSQTDLAERLGISPSYLNLIENNHRPLPAPLLIRLAQLFGVELAAFADDEDGRLMTALFEALADPLFEGQDVLSTEVRELITRRARGNVIRAAMAVLMAIGAFAILKNWDQSLQTKLGGYTTSIQSWIEGSSAADRELAKLRGGNSKAIGGASNHLLAAKLDDFGAAPDFTGISTWLNTPGGQPLSLAGLRGKVVLVDFWTYSCINCLRTLPHLEAWDRAYRKAGLVIVGVHTPEFAFEHVVSNVRGAAHRLGVRYPIAIDNRYGTWEAYGNQYWPAEYLIDRSGHVRHAHFGEGEYDRTESLIRELLATRNVRLAAATRARDTTPTDVITPESYLGYQRLDRYAGSEIAKNREADYRFPSRLAANELAYSGLWRVESERIVAGRDARLRLRYQARYVYLVLGGKGRVQTLLDGKPARTVTVNGDRLYTLVSDPQEHEKLLELRFTPGVAGYAFTFG